MNTYNNKKIAIIGASYLQKPLVEKAKEMGLIVYCFAWEKGAVCKDISDFFYDISIIDKEAILKICQNVKIDAVCSIASDIAAPTVAYISEEMGLWGNKYVDAVNAHNKYYMRRVCNQFEIPMPFFRLLDQNDIIPVYEDYNFPLIVKPVDRSGSLGVTLVKNNDEFQEAVMYAREQSIENKVLVEEFIEGSEVSVEFISFKGRHYPLTITDKETTNAPDFVEISHHQPSLLSNSLYKKIYKITNSALNALNILNGASHTEYKIDKNGNVFLIELGARMGGGFIGSHLVKLSTGYDYLKAVIEISLGYFDFPFIKNQSCSGMYYFCGQTNERLKHIQKNISSFDEIIEYVLPKGEVCKAKDSSTRNGYFIYKSPNKWIL